MSLGALVPRHRASTRFLPLLSPLNFFSSRRSWSSNSRSNCICSICASIRSLLVSQTSSDSKRSAAGLRDEESRKNVNIRRHQRFCSSSGSGVGIRVRAGPAEELLLLDLDSLGQRRKAALLFLQLSGQLFTHHVSQRAGRRRWCCWWLTPRVLSSRWKTTTSSSSVTKHEIKMLFITVLRG